MALGFAWGGVPSWVREPCFALKFLDQTGICLCFEDDLECWSQQLVYRVGMASFLVFAGMLILAISGCASEAAKSLPVFKFVALLTIVAVSYFVPNDIFTAFGSLACIVAAGFSVAQCIWLVDLMLIVNSRCYEQYVVEHRRNPNGRRHLLWLAVLIGGAVGCLVLSSVLAWFLCADYGTGVAVGVTLGTLGTSLALLVLSITDWCKHGALLPSAAVTLFAQYLAWRALSASMEKAEDSSDPHPAPLPPPPPPWLALALGCAALIYLLMGSDLDSGRESQPAGVELAVRRPGAGPSVAAAISVAGDDASTAEESSVVSGEIDNQDFATQCAMHLLAAAYVTSVLAPTHGMTSAVASYVALIVSLLSYLWILVAPRLLSNRDFNF